MVETVVRIDNWDYVCVYKLIIVGETYYFRGTIATIPEFDLRFIYFGENEIFTSDRTGKTLTVSKQLTPKEVKNYERFHRHKASFYRIKPPLKEVNSSLRQNLRLFEKILWDSLSINVALPR